MHTVKVSLGDRSYDIEIGANLDQAGARIEGLGFGRKMALITNPTVKKLYGQRVLASLKAAGFIVMSIEIPDGEQYKNLDWANAIYTALLTNCFDRKSALVALGGGVIGDLTGFAAATFMRGVPFVQVPTTLLAMVDSSVGGKTGVNHPMGKNMIGAFYQPKKVLMDLSVLTTLPKEEFLSGMAEVIKYGVIWDAAFFDYLDKNRDKILGLDADALSHIIQRSCEIKAEVVSKDEREGGLRAILNFGHTVGHASRRRRTTPCATAMPSPSAWSCRASRAHNRSLRRLGARARGAAHQVLRPADGPLRPQPQADRDGTYGHHADRQEGGRRQGEVRPAEENRRGGHYQGVG